MHRRDWAWDRKLWGFCGHHCCAAFDAADGPMKPLPIAGDGASLEGADFPAYLALRLEPLTYPWSARKLGPGFVRIERAETGQAFDVKDMGYALLVVERFNAVEYMRGVRP